MEHSLGQGAVPAAGTFDKSRVWDVKPLRTLKPIFPSASSMSAFSPQAPPFVCAAPSGPFPPGVAPFYPFSVPPESQKPSDQSPQTPVAIPNQAGHYGSNNSVSTAVPISSFRTPPSGPANGSVELSRRSTRNRTLDGESYSQSAAAEHDTYSDNQNLSAQYLSSFNMHINEVEGSDMQKGTSQKRARGRQIVNLTSSDADVESTVNNYLTTYNNMGFDTRRTDGDKGCVEFVLMVFNSLRRKITQIEESKESGPGSSRRPDLRAGALLMSKGIRTNMKKRIGALPGIDVGDIFYFRMEMCVLGLHAPSMGGIDYMSVKIGLEEEPLAVSIVSSGGYDDDADDGNVLLYSGQGGYSNKQQIKDQKLERGNLALEKSLHRANEVRVIRGMKDATVSVGKVYVYDGLYKIQESWIEKGKSGCNVFKYKLVRLPGQPEAFVLWKSIQQWKNGIISRPGVVFPDLTSGAESLPVSLVNDVDDEKGPAHFTYIPSLKHPEPINPSRTSSGCACKGVCQSSKLSCSCFKKNGGCVPYTANGVIVESKSIIYECGPSCSCPPNCRNRVSQAGLKVRLEVFKTNDKGWGLRSWDPIRAGAFICEYAGEVIVRSGDVANESENDYLFDAARSTPRHESIKGGPNDAQRIPYPLIINAKHVGNVARFINHSCAPNVFWQPVVHGNGTEFDLHIAFYAIKNIPPMRELTYDYGMVDSGTVRPRRKRCLCRSSNCRGFID